MNKNVVIETVAVDGILMDYCRFGNGKKNFVIIPGVSVEPVTPAAEFLAEVFAMFAEEYTVFLFDRRKNLPDRYDIEQMAEDTVKVMRYLGLSKADIYGASQGGMIAQIIAINYPEIVESLVLASSAAKPNGMTASVIGSWVETARKGIEHAQELSRDMIEHIYSAASLRERGDDLIDMWHGFTDEKMKNFAIVAEPIISFNCYERLDKIMCRTLVIGSKGDRVLSGKASEEIAEKLGCEFYMYGEEYGHGVYDEAPDFLDKMLAFLLT